MADVEFRPRLKHSTLQLTRYAGTSVPPDASNFLYLLYDFSNGSSLYKTTDGAFPALPSAAVQNNGDVIGTLFNCLEAIYGFTFGTFNRDAVSDGGAGGKATYSAAGINGLPAGLWAGTSLNYPTRGDNNYLIGPGTYGSSTPPGDWTMIFLFKCLVLGSANDLWSTGLSHCARR